MSSSDEQTILDYRRQRLDLFDAGLRTLVADFCPGDHKAVQHRDRKPPWCPHCGRTDRGERITHVDQ